MPSFPYFSVLTTFGVFCALFAIILQGFFASQDLKRITEILSNLLLLENLDVVSQRVAVGYGSCKDIYVPATQFLNYTLTQCREECVGGEISNRHDLFENFGYFFQRGAAAERYTSNKSLFDELVEEAKERTLDTSWSMGGNAPMMARRFHLEGANVLLGAQMTKELRKAIPEDIIVSYPSSIDQDDVHLIMEYRSGEKWGPFRAPRANRFILHNDQNNPTLSVLESLDAYLKDFNPRLFVVSGLQMMDNFPFPDGIRVTRLSKVRKQITSLPSSALVHFEMASYVEIDLIDQLLEYVIPYSDSVGMNEQELENLQRFLSTGTITLAADSNPRVAKTLRQMREIFTAIRTLPVNNPQRRTLTRIHVHTLAYQAILIANESEWKNVVNAAAKAALTAHRHVCGTDHINPDMASLILDDSFATTMNPGDPGSQRIKINSRDPVSCWQESISETEVTICVAPVLVCKSARQTAGAGDNISAAGLILQI
ncbi:ADP-dependent glucokinase [Lutzomyia longipalpis]|uniref:ADP-dependent glucokinase n=1 Tax=Lutzomyia longipalpis TaxID=7200 RepID=UPI002483619A|nr:ADP-dependent glucokinase [Lutzomyia longipalpis]